MEKKNVQVIGRATYRLKAAAEILGVSYSTIRRYVAQGKLTKEISVLDGKPRIRGFELMKFDGDLTERK